MKTVDKSGVWGAAGSMGDALRALPTALRTAPRGLIAALPISVLCLSCQGDLGDTTGVSDEPPTGAAAPPIPQDGSSVPDSAGTGCDAGTTEVRRLNRFELRNTLGTLFEMPVSVESLLPDPTLGGFDRVASILTVSPDLLASYERLFEEVIDAAWADPTVLGNIVSCDPAQQAECAQSILAEWLPRIWRQPVADSDTQKLVDIATSQFAELGFDAGLQLAFKAALLSQRFMYHLKVPSADGAVAALDNYEIANQLSYFLWGDMPDAALFQRAADGELTSPEALGLEVDRMLADPKASGFMEGFVGQWLQIREFGSLEKSTEQFPEFTSELKEAMVSETEEFISAAISENWPLKNLLVSPDVFVNPLLAEHYDMAASQGSMETTRAPATDAARGGLLGQASILSITSPPDQESYGVIRRGVFIMDTLLCEVAPPPPPGVEALENAPLDLTLPLKELLAEHRNDPACSGCHALMDPYGFGLENFDWVGRWREQDVHGNPIDATGTFVDGSTFSGPSELAQAIADSEAFSSCMAEKLLVYSLGRIARDINECAVTDIMTDWNSSEHGLRDLIHRVVKHDAFLTRGTEEL